MDNSRLEMVASSRTSARTASRCSRPSPSARLFGCTPRLACWSTDTGRRPGCSCSPVGSPAGRTSEESMLWQPRTSRGGSTPCVPRCRWWSFLLSQEVSREPRDGSCPRAQHRPLGADERRRAPWRCLHRFEQLRSLRPVLHGQLRRLPCVGEDRPLRMRGHTILGCSLCSRSLGESRDAQKTWAEACSQCVPRGSAARDRHEDP